MSGPAVLMLLVASMVAEPPPAQLGGLARQAELGFATTVQEGQVLVDQVTPDTPAARAGLQVGDRIVEINGAPVTVPLEARARLMKLRAAQTVTLGLNRSGARHELSFIATGVPLEQLNGLTHEYGVLEPGDGARLRTILTYPNDAGRRPLPALFFVQWVSCDTVQFLGEGAWLEVFRRLAESSGMAFIRVERTANGDSEGPACHALDLDTEIAHYRAALAHFASHARIDGDRIVLIGNSLGSRHLPLIAEGHSVAGAITTAGGGESYFERMVAFDAKALARSDRAPAEQHALHMRQARFHAHYLLEGKTPAQVVAEEPDLEGVWASILGTGQDTHYGRPFAYHHQAAAKDVSGAWARFEAPVLVLFNEYDQFETQAGAQRIVDVVNHHRPDTARLVVMRRTGHSFYRYPNRAAAAARDRENRQSAAPEAARVILKWLHDQGLTP